MTYRLTLRTNIARILSEHGGVADWPHAFELARLVLENREIAHALRLRDECLTEGARLAQCFAASGMETRQGGDVKQAPSQSDDSPTAASGDAQESPQ